MNDSKQNNEVKKFYYEVIESQSTTQLDEDAARKAGLGLAAFGQEGFNLAVDRLKKAEAEELRKLLAVIKYCEFRGLDDAMIQVVTTRVLPLDLKVDFFKEMSLMGISLEAEFLQKLHHADELYLQLSGQLKSGTDNALLRSLELVEDFHQLPTNLKSSFLLELEELMPRALPFCIATLGQDEAIDLAVLDIIVKLDAELAAETLVDISTMELPKPVIKKVKKELFRLKEKGVEIPEKKVEKEEVEIVDSGEIAFATTMDSFGARLLLLAIPSLKGYLACQAACDDAKGILRFSAVEMPRKQFREFLKEFKEQVKERGISTLIKIDFAHCCYLLKKAYQNNLATDTLIPESYKQVLYRIKPPEDYSLEEMLKEKIQPRESVIQAMEKDFEQVFTLKEVSFWMVEKDRLLSYTSKYVETLESQIVSDEGQREKILDDSIRDFAAEYFTPEQRDKLLQRFRETAYLLACAGRTEDAEMLFALLLSLEAVDKDPLGHPFYKIFVLRSIVGAIEAFKKQREKEQN